MPITPQSRLILINNTRLTDYKNQMDFKNASEQSLYFLSKKYREYNDFQYLRRDGTIAVPENYDNLYGCDYIMFQNKNFGTKWFYAFIRNKEYANDENTIITFEIDVFQTWQFDIEYLKSFISRSHQQQFLSDGTPWLSNLFPEQVEYGRDYVVTHTEVVSWNTYYVLMCSSADLTSDFGDTDNPNLKSSTGGTFDKMPSVLDYYVIDNLNDNQSPRTDSLQAILSELKDVPWITQCIQSITIVPEEVVGNNFEVVNMASGKKIGRLRDGYKSSNFILSSIDNWWSYFPKYDNSKLYSYPYSYIEMTAYNGNQFIIKPEAVNELSKLELGLVNYVGASPRLTYYLKYYNDFGDNGHEYDGRPEYGEFLDAGLSIANFPQLPVTVDNYLLYMANNANSFALSNSINSYNKKEAVAMGAIEGGAGAISSILSGNIGGTIGSIYGGAKSAYTGVKNSEIAIRQQMAKIQDAEIAPPTLAGQTGGDAFNIANGINGITLKWKTIRPEYAERLEEYFTRYGYVQNKIETVSLTGNKNFNYVQTTGAILAGNIPKDDIEILKNMFDNGTTIWHTEIGKYNDNPWIGG